MVAGSTLSIPCATSTTSASVATPITDPNTSVNYSWLISPNTWSFSSPSSNTTNLTIGSGSGALVTLNSKRSDCPFSNTIAVNISRPIAVTPGITPLTFTLCSPSATQSVTASSANATNYT